MKAKMKMVPRQKQSQKIKWYAGGGIVATAAAFILFTTTSTRNTPDTRSGASTASTFNSGQCRSFNGANSEIIFTEQDLNLEDDDFMTITAWVKWNDKSAAGPFGTIAALNRNNGDGEIGQFWLQHNQINTAFEFAVETSSSRKVVQSTTNPTEGTWYHIAGVYDGSKIKLYVNGVMEAQMVQTGKINNFQGNFELVFGRWANSNDNARRFNGDLDEISIWNIALTETQVRDHMCSKLNGNETGLIGYWELNETTGAMVNDKTNNNRVGTAANTNIVTSGAPVGDESIHTYGGNTLTLDHPNGDYLMANTFSSIPTGVHIFRIDTLPNNVTAPVGCTNISSAYYFGIYIVGTPGITYTSTYYYLGHPGIINPSLLKMGYRSTNADAAWGDAGAILSVGASTFVKSGETGRREYILGTTNNINILPIELLTFEVMAQGDKIKINWSTASEVNNEYFIVEKTVDGTRFEEVARINGAGYSSHVINYTINDYSPYTGISYYRLKQVDYDGETTSFQLYSVNYKVESTEEKQSNFDLVRTYPNPFNSFVKIDIECIQETDLYFELLDLNGKILKKGHKMMNIGPGTYELSELDELIPGTYLLRAFDKAGNMVSKKMIKQ